MERNPNAGALAAEVATDYLSLALAPALYLSAVLFGAGSGSTATLLPAVVADTFGRGHVGAISGFIVAIASTAAAIGPLAASLLREAIETHDPEDWYTVPATPREGRWGEEPTIMRFVRPFNDFTNHLGSIRAIRRILGHPNERTQ